MKVAGAHNHNGRGKSPAPWPLVTALLRVRSFGMIRIRISDPDHSDYGASKEPLRLLQSGFSGSFDAP